MSWCGWWCCCGCPSSSFVQLLVRLVVLLRLLCGMDVLPSVFSCSFFVFLLAAALPNTCSWSAGETGFLQSSLSALAFCSLASLFCFRFSSLPLLRSVFLSHSNERMKEKNSLCSRVAGREGGLLLILLLRLRQGAASAGSATAAEEGYGCGGGYSWASGLARSRLLLVLAMVQHRWCC